MEVKAIIFLALLVKKRIQNQTESAWNFFKPLMQDPLFWNINTPLFPPLFQKVSQVPGQDQPQQNGI